HVTAGSHAHHRLINGHDVPSWKSRRRTLPTQSHGRAFTYAPRAYRFACVHMKRFGRSVFSCKHTIQHEHCTVGIIERDKGERPHTHQLSTSHGIDCSGIGGIDHWIARSNLRSHKRRNEAVRGQERPILQPVRKPLPSESYVVL